MAQGKSLHIGLNQIDLAAYGQEGKLVACENDALSMQKIADAMGFTSKLLLTKDATSANVIQEIGKAAKTLQSGDIFFISYSGHGGQVPDGNGDEDDGFDETWCLYDRMLVDDELYQLWSQFRASVRVIMLSDSCHSGTVLKEIIMPQVQSALMGTGSIALQAQAPKPLAGAKRALRKQVLVSLQESYNAMWGNGSSVQGMRSAASQHPCLRSLTPAQSVEAYRRKKDLYDTLQWMSLRGKDAPVGASIILISGCQDSQQSSDGEVNGLFTEMLLEVWNEGNFAGDYRKLHSEICRRMPPTQVPNFQTAGAPDKGFESQKPFEITAGAVTPSEPAGKNPSVKGPVTWAQSGAPPEFAVEMGENPYYIFEITSQPELFVYNADDSGRTEDTFYASYTDTAFFSDPLYALPDSVWKKLSAASDKLYYRIGTTSSKDKSEGWANYKVSTLDDQGAQAPYVSVT